MCDNHTVLAQSPDRARCPDQRSPRLVTAHLIRNDEAIVRLVGQDMCDQIASLLAAGHGQPVLRSIVSGPLDADKQDSLLRDSYFCAVQYGVSFLIKDFNPQDAYRAIDQSFAEGWDAPEMDEYDRYEDLKKRA